MIVRTPLWALGIPLAMGSLSFLSQTTLIGCNKSGSPSRTSTGIPIVKEIGKITDLDLEAVNRAVEMWKPTKIGDSYYIYITCRQSDGKIGKAYAEMRDPFIAIKWGGDVSEADRLNGLEWKCGGLRLSGKQMRTYTIGWVASTGKWSEWKEGFSDKAPCTASAAKKNGKLELSVSTNSIDAFGVVIFDSPMPGIDRPDVVEFKRASLADLPQ